MGGVPDEGPGHISSYFWNAWLKISNFKAQYLCLHLYLVNTFNTYSKIDLYSAEYGDRAWSTAEAAELQSIYLVYLHSCHIRVCRKVRLLQIESPVRIENIFFLHLCWKTAGFIFSLTHVSELSHLASTALHFIEYASATLHVTSFIDAARSSHCNGGITGNQELCCHYGSGWQGNCNLWKTKSSWGLSASHRPSLKFIFYLVTR